MKGLYKFEQKFGKFSIPNLPIILPAIFGISYILADAAPDIYEKLLFSADAIYGGHQFWRIFTWIFTMPGGFNYFTLVMLFVYFSLGRSVERAIGTFMYNLYIFGTMLAITIGSLIVGAVNYNKYLKLIPEEYKGTVNFDYNLWPTYFLLYTILLGFALCYSDSIMLLMFVIPIQAKWIAVIDLIWLSWEFYQGDAYARVTIGAVILVWLVFVFVMKGYSAGKSRIYASGARPMQRKTPNTRSGGTANHSSKGEVIDFPGKNGKPIHKCAVCGRTEKDDASLEFRYCSKCNGNFEYCSEHLYTHEHVK